MSRGIVKHQLSVCVCRYRLCLCLFCVFVWQMAVWQLAGCVWSQPERLEWLHGSSLWAYSKLFSYSFKVTKTQRHTVSKSVRLNVYRHYLSYLKPLLNKKKRYISFTNKIHWARHPWATKTRDSDKCHKSNLYFMWWILPKAQRLSILCAGIECLCVYVCRTCATVWVRVPGFLVDIESWSWSQHSDEWWHFTAGQRSEEKKSLVNFKAFLFQLFNFIIGSHIGGLKHHSKTFLYLTKSFILNFRFSFAI